MDEQYILFEMLLNVEIEIRALSEFNAVDKFCKKSTYAVYLSTFLCLRHDNLIFMLTKYKKKI
jgi:hypothetical protein